ncbi:Cell wall-associated hydrolase, NlpC family [Amycolatopsis marina]|uniref:Cell wall-associated hydrolase, NlpC family n=1 Tax=Amycolatopsis marina TaxID=490629 RepID=A0A1I1C263_9PSEU|nr:C40 family peptidase [Amycolatopsis marina]SFB56764.1 Cell wall-associated hydrolase, NlpC family [Amycolatopsis marina]
MKPHARRITTRASAATAMAFAVVLSSTTADAQPPTSDSDAMERYEELGAQAAMADEDLLEAQANLKDKQGEKAAAEADLAAATAAYEQAQGAEGQFRGHVDKFAAAALQGAPLSRMSVVLTSDSSSDLLDRMSALELLAADKANALGQLSDAKDTASQAQASATEARQRAQQATAAAQQLVDQVEQRQTKLEDQIQQVRNALDDLAPAQRTELGTVQDTGSYLGPPGAANDALQAALSRRGSEYEWGATGPSEFDCSGLTSWAYRQAGISIPRTSRQQYQAGKQVGLNELQPGDLLFYDDGTGNPGAIHHVGMFVGSGKMVDAPTEGQLVDVRSMEGDGHLIGARRMVG